MDPTITTIIATIVITLTLILNIRQLNETRRAILLDAARQIFQDLDDQKARDNRDFVYGLNGANFGGLKRDERQRAWQVAIQINRVGLMVHYGLLPHDTIYEMYGTVAWRCWRVLEPMVQQERLRRGEPKDKKAYYMMYFQEFAWKSWEFFDKNWPHIPLDAVSPEDENTNSVLAATELAETENFEENSGKKTVQAKG